MARKRKRREDRVVHQPTASGRRGPSFAARALVRTRATITGLLPVVAIVFVTRVALAEAYHIPSGSMVPTLLVGDWLFVNKLRFGPHIPLTNVTLPGYAEPKRGDVAVFVSPPQDSLIRMSDNEVTPTLVKRIVAVAGDTVVMRHGELRVNGVASPSANTTDLLPEGLASQEQPLFAWQHAIEVRDSRFGAPVARPTLHDWGPLVVPAGHYFMMGDNRDNSVDSRFYGTVPRTNLRGAPMFVYYSFDPEDGMPFLRAITAIRWRRLGTWIR